MPNTMVDGSSTPHPQSTLITNPAPTLTGYVWDSMMSIGGAIMFVLGVGTFWAASKLIGTMTSSEDEE